MIEDVTAWEYQYPESKLIMYLNGEVSCIVEREDLEAVIATACICWMNEEDFQLTDCVIEWPLLPQFLEQSFANIRTKYFDA